MNITILAYLITTAILLLIYFIDKKKRLKDKINQDLIFKSVTDILNKMSEINKMQISGQKKKKLICDFILSFSKEIIEKLQKKYGSIQGCVQRIYRQLFK